MIFENLEFLIGAAVTVIAVAFYLFFKSENEKLD